MSFCDDVRERVPTFPTHLLPSRGEEGGRRPVIPVVPERIVYETTSVIIILIGRKIRGSEKLRGVLTFFSDTESEV